MSTLVLVRHGQAAAFEADSDRLTTLGWEQARRLGSYWVQREVGFDEAYVGSLRRHRETAQAVREAFQAQGRAFPEPVEMPGWNEYDGEGIVGRLIPELAAQDLGFRELIQAFERAQPRERNRYFQRMFEVVVGRWADGSLGAEGVEPFAVFHARVRDALEEVTRRAGSRRVAVFTSGGPIGTCVQCTLGAPVEAALAVNWRVRNCSLTELLFSSSRRSLDCFNAIPHLDDPALQSFR